jgi:hypothetical protein
LWRPLVIGAAASAGALGWGAIGAGMAIAIATVLVLVRRRTARSCEPRARGTPWRRAPRRRRVRL